MTLVIVLVVLVVAVVAVVAISRRRAVVASAQRAGVPPPAISAAEADRALHGDVRRLGPGDVVHHDGTDFVVDRTVDFDQDGFRWQEHLLADEVGGRRLWLSVEDDDGVEVAVWQRRASEGLEPGAAELTVDGVAYRLEEDGSASFVVRDATGERERGTMQYADYEAGERLLGFERFGSGGWEVSTGSHVDEHALDIYPAS